MKIHYLIAPNGNLAGCKTYTSLRQLCDENGLNYPNADYHLNRKKDGGGNYQEQTGDELRPTVHVAKVEHVPGKSRGKDNFGK